MADFRVKFLEQLTDTQLEEIVQLCTRAFHGDISHAAFLGRDWDLHSEFFRAIMRATVLEGRLYVVTLGPESEERIVSTASWFGNGVALFGSEEQRSLGFNDFFEKLSSETQHWWNHTYAERITKFDKSLFTEEELAKRWWCFNLATNPEHENKGYARALIKAMHQKASSEGTFIGLATAPEINVKKYLSMGFRERGYERLPVSDGQDFDAHLFSMGGLGS
ncbi:hypothetical protein M422DRAFT_25717 [Sphaerobolus stellatus SS14]|nr:hypothetical protein M422DRAFT_25717 [Sphaerobolus stellatus SS14]